MGRIEKTVFISYRRTDGAWGLAVFQDLTQHGYDVFIDYDGIASGNFEPVILENIKARAHFLVLLTPTALERCNDPEDWMRREIEAALDSERNIVPVMLEGFNFGTPTPAGRLTGKLAALKKYNGLEIPGARYFSSEMERLRNRFLNVRVDAVLHPASDSAQQVANEQKDKATMALGAEQRKAADIQGAMSRAGETTSQKPRPPRQRLNKIGLLTLPFLAIGLTVFGWSYGVRDEFSRTVSVSCSYKQDHFQSQTILISIVMVNDSLNRFDGFFSVSFMFTVDGKEWVREYSPYTYPSFAPQWVWSTSSGRTTRQITDTLSVNPPPGLITTVKTSFKVYPAPGQNDHPSVTGTTDCVAAK
jgi:hypothetical protein